MRRNYSFLIGMIYTIEVNERQKKFFLCDIVCRFLNALFERGLILWKNSQRVVGGF